MGIVRNTLMTSACLALLATSVQAEARVDWARGLLIAKAAASGDLRSPNREMARIKAERQAKKRCVAKLLANAPQIAKAGGGDFSDVAGKLGKSSSITLDTDFGTDGSVVVTMAYPLDQLRSSAFGADKPIDSKLSATPLFIDARKLPLQPGVGFQLSDGKEKYRGPTLFFTSSEAARAHKAVGKTSLTLATALKGQELHLPENALKNKVEGLPLVVILWKQGK